jgi:hypothetical protein
MSRSNLILLGLLVVQAILVALVHAGGDRDGVAPAGPFLDGLSRAAIQRVTLADGDSEVTLQRTDSGWGVTDEHGYGASMDKIDELLHDLVALTTRELVATSANHHVDLEVAADSFNRRVAVTTPEAEHTFFVGKAGRGGATFVRRDGEDEVYSVADFSAHKLTARPAAWLERVAFEADRDRIAGIDVRNAAGSFSLHRDTLDRWTLADAPDGPAVDDAAVGKLLGKVASVRLKEVAGRIESVPVGQPLAEVVVHVARQALPATAPPGVEQPVTIPHTIRVAAVPGDDKTFWLRVDDQPFVVEATNWAVEPLLETARSDLFGAPDGG